MARLPSPGERRRRRTRDPRRSFLRRRRAHGRGSLPGRMSKMMKPAEPRRAPQLSPEREAGAIAPATRGDGLLVPERRADLLRWYEQMLVIRHFEEAAAEQYTRARIGGYLHLNVGEEGTVVGSISALEP